MITSSFARHRNRETSAGHSVPLLLLGRVDGSSPVPLYLQVREVLSEAIRKGVLAPGSQLPSTVAIARQLRVSLLTAHRGLQHLTRDGWLDRSRGQGTFVRADFQAALAAAPRFKIVVAMRGGTESQNAGGTWGCLAGVQAAAAEMVPATERMVHQYRSAGELKQIKADGIICIRPRPEDLPVLEDMGRQQAIVLVGASPATISLQCVDAAHQAGARSAVRHLAALGHERIALVIDPASSAASQERLCGFMLEMGAQKLHVGDDRLLTIRDSITDDALHEKLTGLTRAKHGSTAIVAGDLGLALRVQRCLLRAGLAVPRDVSLVGFGDDWFAEMLSPPMTVVADPLDEMARRGFSRLLQMLNGQPASPDCELLPTSLIVRGSTARLATAPPKLKRASKPRRARAMMISPA